MDDYPPIRLGLNVLRLIAGLLLASVLAFLAVTIWVFATREEPPADPPMLTAVMVGAGFLTVAGVAAVRGTLLARARRRVARGNHSFAEEPTDAGRLFAAWQTAKILQIASLEGAALLSLVATFVDGGPIGLVAGLLFTLLLLLAFPSAKRLEHHLETELAAVSRERGRR